MIKLKKMIYMNVKTILNYNFWHTIIFIKCAFKYIRIDLYAHSGVLAPNTRAFDWIQSVAKVLSHFKNKLTAIHLTHPTQAD